MTDTPSPPSCDLCQHWQPDRPPADTGLDLSQCRHPRFQDIARRSNELLLGSIERLSYRFASIERRFPRHAASDTRSTLDTCGPGGYYFTPMKRPRLRRFIRFIMAWFS